VVPGRGEDEDQVSSALHVNKWGDVQWVNQRDEFHRDDGPAVIHSNGSLLWYKNGRLHREGGPAVIRRDGSIGWFRNGRRVE
jgi:hypothetical protein